MLDQVLPLLFSFLHDVEQTTCIWNEKFSEASLTSKCIFDKRKIRCGNACLSYLSATEWVRKFKSKPKDDLHRRNRSSEPHLSAKVKKNWKLVHD